MADAFPIWPYRRSTAAALAALIVLQVLLFFAVTQRSFFTGDDYYHFKLAQERPFFQYLATPIVHTYPAPGHRLVFFVLQELFPLNYLAARTFLVVLLALTTIGLGHLVRTLASSEQWWTVALLAPFALSLTLVGVVNWWSAGVPVIPNLFFTVIALSAWFRSYTDPRRTFWVGVTVMAIAAAAGFYMKFLLIPAYLLFLRIVIFPRLLDLPSGIRQLWTERMRWIALAAPAILFLAVYVLSGLAARSYVPGDRPFLQFLATAWVGVFIPVSFLNVPLDSSTGASAVWPTVAFSQVLFWCAVYAAWKRSSVALGGWALFVFAFATNMIMVGAVRLPGFGVEIAYSLRYYPEVVLFLPLALALALRQTDARRGEVAWERTTFGQVVIGGIACLYVVPFVIWAPRIVGPSDGVLARSWVDNLRQDIRGVAIENAVPRIVDSDTPAFVIPSWLTPRNRVSTILALLRVDAGYNEWSEPTYVVWPDGHLAEAAFRPTSLLLSGTTSGQGVHFIGRDRKDSVDNCLHDTESVLYRPEIDIRGERLAIRVFYSSNSRGAAALEVDTADADHRFRYLELNAVERRAELVDLGTSRLRQLKVQPAPGALVCVERMEIGSLGRR